MKKINLLLISCFSVLMVFGQQNDTSNQEAVLCISRPGALNAIFSKLEVFVNGTSIKKMGNDSKFIYHVPNSGNTIVRVEACGLNKGLLRPMELAITTSNNNFYFVEIGFTYSIWQQNPYIKQITYQQVSNKFPELANLINQNKPQIDNYSQSKSIIPPANNQNISSVVNQSVVSANERSIQTISNPSDVDSNIPTNKNKSQHTYALIIGNEDYSSFQPDLSSEVNVAFAVNDATVFKKYCTQTLGVSNENIRFLKNGTSGQMSQAISWMNKIIQKENGEAEVIVYYAGHGLPDEQTHEAYIMPVDVSGTDFQSAVKLKNLYGKLTEFPSKKITVFMDACFSGGGRGQGLIAARGVKVKPKEDALTGNIVIFTSSSGEQSSLPFKDKQHGMFTYYLLKKIQETSGNVSYADLYNYVKKEVDLNCVKINSKEQTPNLLLPANLGEKWRGWKLK